MMGKVLLLLLSLAASARRAPDREVSLQKVADYWKHRSMASRISADQARIGLLARVASDTGAAENAAVPYTADENEGITRVDSAAILTAMQKHLSANDWAQLPSPQLKRIKKNRAALKEALGEKSYLWAWTLFELGDRSGAKAILAPLYTAEFARVMSLQKAEYGFFGGPLDLAEGYLHAIHSVSEPGEIAESDEQMRKMKAHVSNLPQSHIMT